jgi:hypothetical protein
MAPMSMMKSFEMNNKYDVISDAINKSKVQIMKSHVYIYEELLSLTS